MMYLWSDFCVNFATNYALKNNTDIFIKITHISGAKFMVHFSHGICTKNNNDIFIIRRFC